jgi:membrane protein
VEVARTHAEEKISIARRALSIFSARGARFLGAAVAFYALLSAAPLFVLVLHVVGAAFGPYRAESALWNAVGVWMAPDALATVRDVTERLDRHAASGSAFGIVLLVYGSTRLFRALRRAINQLWGIDLEHVERQRSTALKYGWRYGGALALALFVAVLVGLLVVEKSALAVLTRLGAQVPARLVWAIDLGTSGVLAFVLFTALYVVLPETNVTLRHALISALVSTVLFALGSSLVTVYVRHKHMDDLYEGASAVVLVVLWVYYSAQVFFLGASVGAALRETDR